MEEEKIVIRRVKKLVHSSGHGGSSWKVAYADFVTAMMAFFLLLWLISMIAPEKQAAISSYFRHFNVFDKSGLSFIQGEPTIRLIDRLTNKKPPKLSNEWELSEKVRKEIEEKLNSAKDQVLVKTFAGGVRIELVDKDASPMFPLGRADLTQTAKDIIKVISGTVGFSNQKVAIEGHTDALTYSSNRYTNWELSTERASAARKEFENNGLSPDTIVRVSGHAATEPLITEDPYDPRNRRISILLYTTKPDSAPDINPADEAEASTMPPFAALNTTQESDSE